MPILGTLMQVEEPQAQVPTRIGGLVVLESWMSKTAREFEKSPELGMTAGDLVDDSCC